MHVFITILAFVLLAILFLVGPDKFNNTMSDVLEKGAINAVRERMPQSADAGSSGIRFKPHLIPLSITLDSREGIILSCEGSIPTPVGTFEVYKNVSFPSKTTLTVVLGDKKHVYDLAGRSFKVNLPNDLEGRSRIEYDGSGSIVVVVPRPMY
jgi:hypothetical protein